MTKRHPTTEEIARNAQALQIKRRMEQAALEQAKAAAEQERKAKAAQSAPQPMTNRQALAGFALLLAFSAWCGFYGYYQPMQTAETAAARHASQLGLYGR